MTIERCSICGKPRRLRYETPIDPPFFDGGHHCGACERWLRGWRPWAMVVFVVLALATLAWLVDAVANAIL